MTNIAEILKNAPQGLKLYSLVHGDVTLESVDTEQEYYPINIIANQNDCTDTLSKDGKIYYEYVDAECVLFPSKEHKTWDNWQEVLFQCGDVVVSQNKTPVGLQTFLCYGNDDEGYLAYGVGGGKNYITPSYYRYATPEEREQFFKELENNGYIWNDEIKQIKSIKNVPSSVTLNTLIDAETKEKPFSIDQFKPFDKVLVRDTKDEEWKCDLFSHAGKYIINCVSTIWKKCIPYNDETKHLLGTTDDAPDKYKTW